MEIGKDVNLANLGLAAPTSSAESAELDDTFMTLMLTQLKNQDPFQPMEGGEFLSQLAQFEMTTGVQSMQESLNTLSSTMMSNQVMESAALVGKTVFAAMSSAHLDAGGTVEGAVDVPPGSSTLSVEIRDGGGALVRRMQLPAATGARQSFVWDGLDASGQAVPAGNYNITADANVDGAVNATRVLLADQVRSVSLGGGGQTPVLNLASGGQLSFAEILEIR